LSGSAESSDGLLWTRMVNLRVLWITVKRLRRWTSVAFWWKNLFYGIRWLYKSENDIIIQFSVIYSTCVKQFTVSRHESVTIVTDNGPSRQEFSSLFPHRPDDSINWIFSC